MASGEGVKKEGRVWWYKLALQGRKTGCEVELASQKSTRLRPGATYELD